MKRAPVLLPLALLSSGLAAQAPPPNPLKWHGALWASAAASDRQAPQGALFLRSLDAGEGAFALDGLAFGADLALVEGWSLRFTVLGGQDGKVLAAAGLESGSLTFPEAMLIWTGARDVVRIGRMYTFTGMEFLDHTQDVTASRGLLFTYAIPLDQVGLAWRHTFSPQWSSDLWLFNGENRVQDNNRGKTLGLGLNYTHGGVASRYVTVQAYRGPEQDAEGPAAQPGAEGRMRERMTLLFGWDWGATSLAGEVDAAQETLPDGALAGAPVGPVRARWSGAGVILKRVLDQKWALFLRAETLKDDQGWVLSGDPALAQPGVSTPGVVRWANTYGANLRATSFAFGAERKWGEATFSRLEVRRDALNREVQDRAGRGFREATSATWSFGASF